MSEAESYINGSLNQAFCVLGDFIDANDKDDHIHYGCAWHIREDGIYHVCCEQKREWKL